MSAEDRRNPNLLSIAEEQRLKDQVVAELQHELNVEVRPNTVTKIKTTSDRENEVTKRTQEVRKATHSPAYEPLELEKLTVIRRAQNGIYVVIPKFSAAVDKNNVPQYMVFEWVLPVYTTLTRREPTQRPPDTPVEDNPNSI
jgi:hypothetical protein